jgi:hypothetical protein
MIIFPSRRTLLTILLMAALAGLAFIATKSARADDAPGPRSAIIPYDADAATVTIQKQWSLSVNEVCEPTLDKTANARFADALSGNATLTYTIGVDHVDTTFIDAQIDAVTVTNTATAPITIDIVDTLYCDAGGGVPGVLVTQVFTETGVTLAADQSTVISGGNFDITVCAAAAAVNRVEVFQAGTSDRLAGQDFTDPPVTALGCALAQDSLTDVETLPPGYSVEPESIVVQRDGQPIEPLSAVASGNQFTVTLDSVSNVTAATYTLQKEVVRQSGSACQPAVVRNVASALNVDSAAQINLTCGPPHHYYLPIVRK